MAKNNGNDDGDYGELPSDVNFDDGASAGSSADEGYSQAGWKGFEEEEEDGDPAIVFGGRREVSEEDDLDMTPMVDVTFLLLIFFMVTASFTLQKSIEDAKAETDDPSTDSY